MATLQAMSTLPSSLNTRRHEAKAYPGTDVLDDRRHVDDVIFVVQLLVAYFQVDLSQQQLHAHHLAKPSQQRHTLQPVALRHALDGVTVETAI